MKASWDAVAVEPHVYHRAGSLGGVRRCMHACVCTETASGPGPMIEITLMSTLCSDIGTLVADRASKLLQLPGCRLVPTG